MNEQQPESVDLSPPLPANEQNINNAQPQANQQEEEDDGELLKYGAKSVLMVIIPVSVCLLVVVTTISSVTYYTQNQGTYLYVFTVTFQTVHLYLDHITCQKLGKIDDI